MWQAVTVASWAGVRARNRGALGGSVNGGCCHWPIKDYASEWASRGKEGSYVKKGPGRSSHKRKSKKEEMTERVNRSSFVFPG